ncbi:hypothetical protein B0H14DRAFT_2778706 [Mycena olivaceomarginata]|nr:hypothetical protein B0H14DRAFT_2778706 [Mycena olivaceomarginata]
MGGCKKMGREGKGGRMRSLARSQPRLALHPDYARLLFGRGGDLNNEIDPAPLRTRSHKSGHPNHAEVALRVGEALKWSSHIVGADPASSRSSLRPTARARRAGEATMWELSEGTSGDCALVGNQVQNFRGWFSCFVLSLSSPPQTNCYFGRLPPQ